MNGGTRQLFIGEAADNQAIPQDLMETAKQYTNKLFTDATMNIIYNLIRKQKNESELEHDMHAKSRRQNRSQQHSYGRGGKQCVYNVLVRIVCYN